MSLLKQREDAAAKALQIAELAKSEERDLTDEEIAVINETAAEVAELDEKIKAADEAAAKLKALGTAPARKEKKVTDDVKGAPARSLGEHFVKHAAEQLAAAKASGGRFSVGAPAFVKAATDTHTVTEQEALEPYLTQLDRNIVKPFREGPVVADLLSSGTISGQHITYLVEQVENFEGAFAPVAEGGAKPQVHVAALESVTETLKKLAGWIKLSDEMIEDLPFVVSEINGTLLYQLALHEEFQLLNGDGTDGGLVGIRNRSGILTESATDADDNADALFRAMTQIRVVNGVSPDALVINPSDYQDLRLGKDGNGQYHGGGYFQGQYGNGGILENPPVWGLRTVVSSAVPAGTALVGAFKYAATVYRKGGVRVESTNSHDDDFTNNLVTIRAEERLALAVRRPSAIAEVTLAGAGS